MSLQKYILPTPSIDAFYSQVKKCIQHRTPGAIIYGQPRFGKTYSIRYAMNILVEDFRKVVVFSFLCHMKGAHSEAAFFSNLLEAAGHASPHTGTIAAKRSRLIHFLKEKVDRSGQNLLVVFADESQRLGVIEYEWLRDVHDELERRGVRMITFLVGQPELLHRKNSFRESKQTQIIARFMIDEFSFRGLLSGDDIATCLDGYDESIFPENSGWSYTRFFFPKAFADGFRLISQATSIWNAFCEAHEAARFSFAVEIPMQYFARAVEIVFSDYAQHDSPELRLSPQIWIQAVRDANYVQAQEEMRLALSGSGDD